MRRLVIEYATRTPDNIRNMSVYNAQIRTIIDEGCADTSATSVLLMLGIMLSADLWQMKIKIAFTNLMP
jgi:hypothetical protein